VANSMREVHPEINLLVNPIQRVMGSVDGILWAMSCADTMLSRALQLYHMRGSARPDTN
jgi:hypothetical protein